MIIKSIVGQLGPPNKEPNLGLQKSALWRHMAPNPPQKWSLTWTSKLRFMGPKLAPILGTLLVGIKRLMHFWGG